MILSKLEEALASVESERTALDEIEQQLRSMIAKLSGAAVRVQAEQQFSASALRFARAEQDANPDKIDDVVDILRKKGEPLHITVIAELLSQLRGVSINRTAIEPGLNRHITKTKKPRLTKAGRSTFGLPEWNEDQRGLPMTA